jgi:hypothetical protein
MVCVAVAVLIYYGITLLLPVSKRLGTEVENKKTLLRKQLETLDREAIYKSRLDQFSKRLETDRTRLLPGDNPNIAAAELQKVLKDFADQCGVEILQKSFLQEEKIQDLLVKVSVRINTNCSLEQLVRFLTAIENYEKYLRVEEFVITSFKIQKRNEIRPILTVAGFIHLAAAKS